MRDSPRPPRPPTPPVLRVPGGVKHARYDLFLTPGAGTWRAPRSGWYWALAYGPGGTGGASLGSASSGGGGGGAVGKRMFLRRGQPVNYDVASTGSPTTITIAALGVLISAAPGQNGNVGFTPGAFGGAGTGGDIVRRGGNAGGETNPDSDVGTSDGVISLATRGEYGGLVYDPGTGSLSGSASGSGAGFTDILPFVKGDGVGAAGGSPSAPGVPGGGSKGAFGGAAPLDGASGAVAFVYDG